MNFLFIGPKNVKMRYILLFLITCTTLTGCCPGMHFRYKSKSPLGAPRNRYRDFGDILGGWSETFDPEKHKGQGVWEYNILIIAATAQSYADKYPTKPRAAVAIRKADEWYKIWQDANKEVSSEEHIYPNKTIIGRLQAIIMYDPRHKYRTAIMLSLKQLGADPMPFRVGKRILRVKGRRGR